MHFLKVSAALVLSLTAFVSAAPTPSVFITAEKDLTALWNGPMYQQYISSTNGTTLGMPRADGGAVNLPWRYYPSLAKETKNTIILTNGRAETVGKFREFIYDLSQNGFNVLTWDHRGQGLAPRLGCQPTTLSDVEDFNEGYVGDMQKIITDNKKSGLIAGHNLLFWGHSMGGGIGVGHMQKFPGTFAAAVLSAPMLEINTDPYPGIVALPIADIIEAFGGPCAAAPGQNPVPGPVQDPNLGGVTTSAIRFTLSRQIYTQFPNAQLGGSTARWVSEAISAIQAYVLKAKYTTTPIQLHQAALDTLVNDNGQNVFCKGLKVLGVTVIKPAPKCQLIRHEAAKHEIWAEVDSIRTPYMNTIIAYFRQFSV
ncbi:Alpha/Beta hydrolase protein [Powellomyces hirtus]|nr:Alpha/Beta hydrolase protein [Powellomyces hirtus]